MVEVEVMIRVVIVLAGARIRVGFLLTISGNLTVLFLIHVIQCASTVFMLTESQSPLIDSV